MNFLTDRCESKIENPLFSELLKTQPKYILLSNTDIPGLLSLLLDSSAVHLDLPIPITGSSPIDCDDLRLEQPAAPLGLGLALVMAVGKIYFTDVVVWDLF